MELDSLAEIYTARGFKARVGWGIKPALLVIDLTNGFTDPASPLGADLTAVIAETNRLLEVARAYKIPVIFTSIAYDDPALEGGHWVRKIPALGMLRFGTPAVEVDPRLARRSTERLLFKRFTSAFAGTDLAAMLQFLGIDTLVICGTSTSGCIRASVVDGVTFGFRCIVPAGAVGDRAEAPHRANLFDIDSKYADVVPVADAVDALIRIAGRNAA
jgi:nicotinamidase-related amidase